MELIEVLDKVGLDQKQSVIYLAVLELGTGSVYSIAKKSGLKRPTVYRILDELRQKGLVSQIPRVKKVLYAAESPEKLISDLKKKEELLKSSLPNLLALYNAKKEKPQVRLFEGKEGVRQVYQKIYENKEMWFFGTIKDVQAIYPEGLKWFLENIKEKNIKVRELLTPVEENYQYADAAREAKSTEIKFLNSVADFPITDVGLFGDNVAFFSFRPQIFAVVVTSKEISGSLKIMYEFAG